MSRSQTTTEHVLPDDGVPAGAPESAAEAVPTTAREALGARFAHLFAFSGLSNLADGLVLVGVPLYGLTLTSSPGQISLLTTAITAPWLAFGLVAGLLIDRHDRVRILVAATLVRVAVFAGAGVAAATGALTLPLLLALLLVLGTAEVFADGSSSALVPDVTPRSRLAAANSRLMGVQLAANSFLGAPIAGFLLAAGAGWLFGVPAGLLLAGVLVVLRGLWGKVARVRVPGAPDGGRSGDTVPEDPAATRGTVVGHGPAVGGAEGTTGSRPLEPALAPVARSVRRELREGLAFLLRHRVIRLLVLGGMSFNFLSNAYMAVFVLWLVGPGSAVGLAPEQYGLFAMGFAVGGLTGAVLAEKLVGTGRDRAVVGVTWGMCAVLLAVPALWPNAWVVAGSFALVGFFNVVGNTATSALRQRLVPSHILGRVQGASATLAYGAMPLGALLGGLVAEAFGVRTLLLTVAVGTVVVAAATARALSQPVIDAAERDAAPAHPS